MIAKLALEDGSVFSGRAFGATGTRVGEVVFNTALTGYQEIFSDPSYCGQIVTMTFPLIGNYGVNPDDFEAARPYLSGFVVKQLPRRPSNFRATAALSDLLKELDVVGLADVDTRGITRRVRVHGALRGVLTTEDVDDIQLVRQAQEAPEMVGANLVTEVAPREFSQWEQPLWRFPVVEGTVAAPEPEPPVSEGLPIVVLDCGIKHNILRHLADCGCRVTVAPADAAPDAIRAHKPAGIMISNGPGDPAAVEQTVATLRELIGEFPIFGVCLGHQMLGLALGAETYKLRFGHHGANVPVRNTANGRVEITSQNHGFAVDQTSLKKAGAVATHINLNDHSVEGLLHADKQVLAVQFHPEASPGPHDAGYIFRRVVAAIARGKPLEADLLAQESEQ